MIPSRKKHAYFMCLAPSTLSTSSASFIFLEKDSNEQFSKGAVGKLRSSGAARAGWEGVKCHTLSDPGGPFSIRNIKYYNLSLSKIN